MEEVRVARLRVANAHVKQFEAGAIEQVEHMHSSAPGVIAYAFARRSAQNPAWPSLLANPLAGTTEYVLFSAALDSSGEAQLATQESAWRSTVTALLAAPMEVETIEQPSFVAGISREHRWTPDSIYRCTLFRMRAASADPALEEGLLRMMKRVAGQEPDPPLYALARRHDGGSSFIPAGPAGLGDYIRFNVYRTQEGFDLHNELDKEWWSKFYQSRIAAPLDSLFVEAVAGFTRDHLWGAAETSDSP